MGQSLVMYILMLSRRSFLMVTQKVRTDKQHLLRAVSNALIDMMKLKKAGFPAFFNGLDALATA